MSTPQRPSSAQLPSDPSFRHLKLQARRLFESWQSADSEAYRRVRATLPRLSDASDDDIRDSGLTLREAQFIVGREYGFDSWAKLKAHVESVVESKPASVSDHYGPLELAHQKYASFLADILSDASGEQVQVTAGPMRTSLYETFTASISGTCCFYRFPINPDDWPLAASAPVAIDLSVPLVGSILQHPSPTSNFIYENRMRLVRFVTRIVADFERIWEVSPAMRIGDAQLTTDPAALKTAESGDECLIVPFDVQSAGLTTRLHLCYPKKTMEGVVLPYLSGRRVDRFEPIAPAGRDILTEMFSNHERCRIEIDRILDGLLGTALVDDTTEPTVAHLVVPDGHSIFGGDPSSPAAREMVETRRTVRLVPESDDWTQLIEEVYGDELERAQRIEFSPSELRADHLKRLIDEAPGNGRIERIDTELGERIKRRLHPQLYSGYESAEDFMNSGAGFCAIIVDEPVCCVSTTFTHRGKYGINLETVSYPVDSGFELAVSATLLVHCLESGIEPHWRWVRKLDSRLAKRTNELGYGHQVYDIFIPR